MRKNLNIFLAIVSVSLILIGIAVSRQAVSNPLQTAPSIIGDLLVVVAINVLVVLTASLTSSGTVTTLGRLSRLGWTVLTMAVYLLVVSYVVQPADESLLSAFPESSIAHHILLITLIVFIACVFAALVLVQLHGFVLIKRKRHTRSQFHVLYVCLMAYIVISAVTRTDFIAEGFQSPGNFLQFFTQTAGFFAIFFMVMSSFRNAWINYLNKRQKLYSLLAGIALCTALIVIENSTGSIFLLYLRSYSLSAAIFFNMTKYFILIYLFLAIASLLLHLPTAGIFDKKVQQLTSLFQIGSALTAMLKFDKLLQLTSKQTIEVVEADSAWLMMKKKHSKSLKLSATSNVQASLLNVIRHRSFANITDEIIQTKQPLVIHSLQNYKELPIDRNTRKTGSSLIGVPLISPGRGVLGVLFAYKAQDYAFDQEDTEIMRAFANQTTIAIENSLLLEESFEKERLQQELNVARDIQLKLLPKEIPHIADHIRIEALSIPAYEVGGDYYDFIQLDNHRLGIYVGDVSGKSISAALYMAEIKGFIQALARLYHSPKELLMKINETLFTNIDRRSFISMLAAVIDFKENKVVFTRAGHTPLGYYNPNEDSWKLLQPKGLGLGLDRGKIFNRLIEEVSIDFVPGTVVFLYTDGVTEVFDKNGELFGDDRLLELLEKCKRESVDNYCRVILEEINSFSSKEKIDDMTMVVIRNEEPGT